MKRQTFNPDLLNAAELKTRSLTEQIRELQLLLNDTAAAEGDELKRKAAHAWQVVNELLPDARSHASESTPRTVFASWIAYLCDWELFRTAILFRMWMILSLDQSLTRRNYMLTVYPFTNKLYKITATPTFLPFNSAQIIELHECCCFMTDKQCEKFASYAADCNWGAIRKLITAYQKNEPRAEALAAAFIPPKKKRSTENKTAGQFYDLETVFNNCNEHRFEGKMPRPAILTWSARSNKRVMGSYDIKNDVLSINRALDSADVPDFVLDFIMYHELLHKALGVKTDSAGRNRAHSAEFRRYEQSHPDYLRAQEFIKNFSSKL